ncbi:MAG: cytochrome d ubiquinol oxidase subunit II [Bradyrhizobium sp.]
MTPIDYPVLFAIVSALAIGLYVTLDGFDLGVGILFPFAPSAKDRNRMMQSLAPMWDGNETWLVLGGMVLLCAFPTAFSILLPAFYVPLGMMLFGLVLRGISFEFRSQGGPLQIGWTFAFAAGSFLAAFFQGAILGAFVSGDVTVADKQFAGGPLDWITLFSIATGFGVVAGYALLGAGWLIWRTEGTTQIFAREIARPTLMATGAAIALVSIWTPLSLSGIWARWFSWPNMIYLAPLPIVAALSWLVAWRSLWGRREWLPFCATILLFASSLGGLGASIWPAAVPGALTFWEASSALRTQEILALALAAILPLVLAYTAFSYWVFRGKITVSDLEGETRQPEY